MTDPVIPTDLRPRILLGHVLDRLREMPEGSVQMAVTSPPYWGLRAYGTPPQVWGGDRDHAHEGQVTPPRRFRSEADATSDIEKASIGGRSHEAQGGQVCGCGAWLGELGAEPTPELYVAHLADVFDEVRRVLRDDGTLWLNLGDSYIGGGRGSGIGKDGKRVTFERAENFSHWLITEKLISTVPWDDAGAYVRFSVTFSARDIPDERRVLSEIDRRLADAGFEF